MFAHLKSCHSLVLLLKLDDIQKFNSIELVRLTWIWHPGMSTQKLGFQSTLQLLEFKKAVITELAVSALCNAVCTIMHQTLVPRSPEPLDFGTCWFPSALIHKLQKSLSSFIGKKKRTWIKTWCLLLWLAPQNRSGFHFPGKMKKKWHPADFWQQLGTERSIKKTLSAKVLWKTNFKITWFRKSC